MTSDAETISRPVRFGVLGCARVVDYGLIAPARETGAATVAALASRDLERATAYAAQHGIAPVIMRYDEVIGAPSIDALYIPLPSTMHDTWASAAMEAGMPVLCEKPLAANAARAQALLDEARRAGATLVEATHWRHHPVVARLIEIVQSGEIGEVRSMEIWFRGPADSLGDDDIRYSFALGGGCMLDMGCYCAGLARLIVGTQPEEIVEARSVLRSPEIDVEMHAVLRFPGAITATLMPSMNSAQPDLDIGARVRGSAGELLIRNAFMPNMGSSIAVTTPAGSRKESFTTRSSYAFQLDAFAAILTEGAAPPFPLQDAVDTLAIVDAVYLKAGMSVRG